MVVAKLFILTKNKTLKITWFKVIHDKILNWRNQATTWLRNQDTYKHIHRRWTITKLKLHF